MDGETELKIMSQFPFLSMSDDLKKWRGFITTEGQAILISLLAPNFPSAEGFKLDSRDLNAESCEYWDSVLEKISEIHCGSFLELLERIEMQVIPKTSDGDYVNKESVSTDPNLYSTIIDEIENVGVSNIVNLSDDFRDVIMKHVDRSKREHRLKLSIPLGYPEVKAKVCTDLPFSPESITWPSRIQEIYQLFRSHVDKCCKFWDDMDELDSFVKVVDPTQPNRSHYHRKALLDNNVIIHLTFNALVPRALPQVSFSGPERCVEAFSASIDSGCNKWDESLTVIRNLQMVLGCEFILKDNDEDEEMEQTLCTVCYVYSFEDEIPEVSCDCGSVFHRKCLYDLFVSDISKTALRRSVDCPNCQMEIRVPATFAASTW
ncbi:E3 ubiquitin-protein ligase FANCL [Orchesella cincta]|uniref:E3 ubiquitin-protein ligase FANCL n=1 Tax=Orchesella cincta TaxID=48709 RepID=A0A1D2MSP9_ORCCI|nr:E3 ubiquitin-protein ligase FANCL [Orchesella cincta]